MNKVDIALVRLLSAATGCCDSVSIDLGAQEWQQLCEDAFAHQIHSIIFSKAHECGCDVNPELFDSWGKNTIIQVLQYSQRFDVFKNMFVDFEKANVPVMALKGLHYKYLYPEPDMRSMSDIDLLTKQQYLEEAMKVIEGYGYVKTKEDAKHINLAHIRHIPIELHFSLFTEEKRRAAADFNNEIWESNYLFEADNISFLVPSDINQIIYCCVHMTNHFGMGGFGLRQLSDLNLLVRRVTQTIDWKYLFDRAYGYGIGKFVEVVLFICYEFFNLDIPQDIVGKYSKDREYIDNMISAIFSSGVFGGKDSRSASYRALARYISPYSGGGRVSRLTYIFPPSESLSDAYSYARKYKLLLPVAWLHRIVNNVARKDMGFSDKMPDAKGVDEYVRLFKWLDIKRK